MTRLVALASVLAVGVLALHAAGWLAAGVVLVRSLHAPPIQSAVTLGLSGLLLRLAGSASRKGRIVAVVAVLATFSLATIVLPLDFQFADTGFMGDGLDYAQHRDKFEENVPLAADHHELHFKSHLGDLLLAGLDRLFGRTDLSIGLAYRVLSNLGGLLLVGELLAVLYLWRGSRRACRFIALALAAPLAIGFFGYYELGYLSACLVAVPLVLHSIQRRTATTGLELGAALQGVHTALHGFGLLGIVGGSAAAMTSRYRPWSAALRFATYALAGYLVWILFDIVALKVSIVADQYSGDVALRALGTSFFFDRRLVDPLLSWRAAAEIGIASLAAGVPLLALAVVGARSALERRAALLYALPGLAFMVVWWPSAGVNRDMDLLLAAFGGIGGAIWLMSRTSRDALVAWAALLFAHVMLWAAIADRTMDRVWQTP